jgi:large subunit ribosomal protein L3
MNVSLLGKKIGMTQVFGEDNRLHPVTVVQVGPCPITQIKTIENDGYNAVQIGFGEQKESRLSKAEVEHLKKANVAPLSHLKEFRVEDISGLNVGDVLTVSSFQDGELIDVVGVTKGRGFQGVMKRYGFSGGPASHGSMFHRRGGSFGMRQTPGRIFKNKKMPGHMGDVRCTVQNLEIIKVIPEKHILLIKGSLPGGNGSLLSVRTAKKRKKKVA